MLDTSGRRLAADAGPRRVRAYARRANSEDSIEVLSTTESIFPDDLTAITEEEAEYQAQSNGREDEKESTTTECESDHVNAAVSGSGDEKDESPKHTPVDSEALIKEGQIIESLKSDQVHEVKPVKKSKLLQGNISATVSIFSLKLQLNIHLVKTTLCDHGKTFMSELNHDACLCPVMDDSNRTVVIQ